MYSANHGYNTVIKQLAEYCPYYRLASLFATHTAVGFSASTETFDRC